MTLPLAARRGERWYASPDVVTAAVVDAGATLDAVKAAITRRPAFWSVDTRHSAWLSLFAPPATATTTQHASSWPAGRWRSLHVRSTMPVADPVAEIAWIRTLADGMNGNCQCRRHWAEYLASSAGPTLAIVSSPAAYERWAVDAHNAVNDRLDRPTLTVEQARHAQPLAVHATDSGGGIGDTVVALYAVCGLARATGRPVEFHARWSDWIARASFPGVIVTPHRADVGLDISGGWGGPHGYYKATASAPSRVWAYCSNLAAGFDVPAFGPAKPTVDRRPPATPTASGRYALVAPFVANPLYSVRQWPADKFRQVAAGLVDRGYQVIGLGAADQAQGLAEVLAPIAGATWRYGCPAAEIVDLVLGASLLVGNDSGMVHLGGLLGTPTIAVHAGLPRDYLYTMADSVVSVTPAEPVPRSDANGEALAAIPASAVLAAVP